MPKNKKKKRYLLCNYSEVVKTMAVKMIPFYGSSSCLYCYSSAAAAEPNPETPTTAAATNYMNIPLLREAFLSNGTHFHNI